MFSHMTTYSYRFLHIITYHAILLYIQEGAAAEEKKDEEKERQPLSEDSVQLHISVYIYIYVCMYIYIYIYISM